MTNDVLNEAQPTALAICLAATRVLKHQTDQFRQFLGSPADCLALIQGDVGQGACPLLASYLGKRGNLERCAVDIANWQERGIKTSCILDGDYPPLLRTISNPPLILFYRGVFPDNFELTPMLAVVGSRNCDKPGADIAFEISKDIANAGGCIVSGLALGIDAMAHRGAIRSRNPPATIAILGNGLNSVYPTSHERLAAEIIECGGVLISQFEPDEKPYPANFLNRNRLIAGIGQGVLVVQASKRSGSLVTARYALEEGREVMAIPGSILDPRHEGTNKIIKDGAYLIRSAADVWEVIPSLKVYEVTSPQRTIELDAAQKMIFELVRLKGPIHQDLLAQQSTLGEDLPAAILGLELADLIERQPGNFINIKHSVGR